MSTFLEHAPHLRRKNYRRAAALTRVNMVLLSLYTTQTRMNSCIQPYGYNPDIANWSLFYECSFINSFILFIKPTQEPLHNPPHILKQRLKDNKLNSLYFARECIRIFFLGHYLFLQAHSFLRALLSKNCSHLQVEQIKSANKYPYVF